MAFFSSRGKWAAVTAVWLMSAWTMPYACSTQPSQTDGGQDATNVDAGCSGFSCTDAALVDPCGDAAIGIRARAQLIRSCAGGSESGCHSEFAGGAYPNGGGTTLEVDRDGAATPYDTFTTNCPYGCGIIDVPADEMPDVMLVVPFHPESSYLYWKITGDPRITPGTGIMPLSNASDWDSGSVDCVADPMPYCSCVVATLGAWIEAGAP